MTSPPIRTRWATVADLPGLRPLMAASIDALQADLLSAEQIVASRQVMGLDTQLVVDGTYLIAEVEGTMAGCGGWSRRSTLYGGDHSGDLRDPRLLDLAREPARIRAMYTHPRFARRGIGRLILGACEGAAADAGFRTVELMATLSGERLYRTAGYTPIERADADVGGVTVPLILMRKAITTR